MDDPRKRALAEQRARAHYGADFDSATPESREAAVRYFESQIQDSDIPERRIQDIARNPVNPAQGERVRNILRNQAQGRAADNPTMAGPVESFARGAAQGALRVASSPGRAILRGAAALGVPGAGDLRQQAIEGVDMTGVPEDRMGSPISAALGETGGEFGAFAAGGTGLTRAGAGLAEAGGSAGARALGRLLSMGNEALQPGGNLAGQLARRVGQSAVSGAAQNVALMPDEFIDAPGQTLATGAAFGAGLRGLHGLGELPAAFRAGPAVRMAHASSGVPRQLPTHDILQSELTSPRHEPMPNQGVAGPVELGPATGVLQALQAAEEGRVRHAAGRTMAPETRIQAIIDGRQLPSNESATLPFGQEHLDEILAQKQAESAHAQRVMSGELGATPEERARISTDFGQMRGRQRMLLERQMSDEMGRVNDLSQRLGVNYDPNDPTVAPILQQLQDAHTRYANMHNQWKMLSEGQTPFSPAPTRGGVVAPQGEAPVSVRAPKNPKAAKVGKQVAQARQVLPPQPEGGAAPVSGGFPGGTPQPPAPPSSGASSVAPEAAAGLARARALAERLRQAQRLKANGFSDQVISDLLPELK